MVCSRRIAGLFILIISIHNCIGSNALFGGLSATDPPGTGYDGTDFYMINETRTIVSQGIHDASFQVKLGVFLNYTSNYLEIIVNDENTILSKNKSSFDKKFTSGEFIFQLKSEGESKGSYWWNSTIIGLNGIIDGWNGEIVFVVLWLIGINILIRQRRYRNG